MTEIAYLREFDEELVFLVTDSFNANTQARSAFASGDISSALVNLENAKIRLDQANGRLDVLKEASAAVLAEERSSMWWIWLILVSLMIAATIYLFQKVPEGSKEQY